MGRGKGTGEETSGLTTRRRVATSAQVDAIAAALGAVESTDFALYAGTRYDGVALVVVVGIDPDSFADLEMELSQAALRPVELLTLEQLGGDDVLLARALEEGEVLVDKSGTWEQLAARKLEVTRRAYAAEAALTEQARGNSRG